MSNLLIDSVVIRQVFTDSTRKTPIESGGRIMGCYLLIIMFTLILVHYDVNGAFNIKMTILRKTILLNNTSNNNINIDNTINNITI